MSFCKPLSCLFYLTVQKNYIIMVSTFPIENSSSGFYKQDMNIILEFFPSCILRGPTNYFVMVNIIVCLPKRIDVSRQYPEMCFDWSQNKTKEQQYPQRTEGK